MQQSCVGFDVFDPSVIPVLVIATPLTGTPHDRIS